MSSGPNKGPKHFWTKDELEYITLCVGDRGHQSKTAVFKRLAEELGVSVSKVSSQYYLANPRPRKATEEGDKAVASLTKSQAPVKSAEFIPGVFMGQLQALLDTYYSAQAERVKDLEREVDELGDLVGAWISQSVLKRVTQQRDFEKRLLYQVDKVGNVIKIIKEGGDR